MSIRQLEGKGIVKYKTRYPNSVTSHEKRKEGCEVRDNNDEQIKMMEQEAYINRVENTR